MKLILFGSGSCYEKTKTSLLENSIEIIAIADNDIGKQGRYLDDKLIITPKQIKGYDYDFIFITSEFSKEIENQLLALGISKEKILSNIVYFNYDFKRCLNYHIDHQKILKKNPTIISEDCWGGYVYKRLDLKYNTPFIFLSIDPEEYIRLLESLEYYLNCNLTFVNTSAFDFPVGKLDDIKIFFNHDKSEIEAKDKWNRRLERVNWDNIYVKHTITQKNLAFRFNKLNFKNKIAFTNKDFQLSSCIYAKEWEKYKDGYKQFNHYIHDHYDQYIDIFEWLTK